MDVLALFEQAVRDDVFIAEVQAADPDYEVPTVSSDLPEKLFLGMVYLGWRLGKGMSP